MSVHRFPPSHENAAEERAKHYRQVLRELIEFGMEIARAVNAQVKAGASDAPSLANLAIAYERVSAGIRRSIMLVERVGCVTAPPVANHRTSARRRILREVEDAIQRNAKRADQKQLQAELHERLDGPDVLEDVDHRPIPEIIAEICRDLGLAAIPGLQLGKRRTPADIAALCKLAARGSRTQAGRKPTVDQSSATEPERLVHLFPLPKRD